MAFWYCNDCVEHLDERDAAMNLKVLELVNGRKSDEELKREYDVHSLEKLREVAAEFVMLDDGLHWTNGKKVK